MNPKLSKVVTKDERAIPAYSGDTSMAWSRDKSKTLSPHIHKVHVPKNLVGC